MIFFFQLYGLVLIGYKPNSIILSITALLMPSGLHCFLFRNKVNNKPNNISFALFFIVENNNILSYRK